MEMLQLRYFYETAIWGSFTKTAERYMVPPTSVSASVKRLEKELGCALFHRAHNRITLNEHGKRLQQSLRVVFRELDEVVEELSAPTADTREIRVLVRAMRLLVADCIIAYKAAHPNVAFQTVFSFEDVNIKDYDVIIDEKSDAYSGFDGFDLLRANIRISAAVDHPLCGQKLTLRQLEDQAFISVGRQNGLFRILTEACERVGFAPRIAVQSNDLMCHRRFLESGVGLALHRIYDGKEEAPYLRLLDVTDFDETQTICAYYNPISNYGNVQHFLQFLQNHRELKRAKSDT